MGVGTPRSTGGHLADRGLGRPAGRAETYAAILIWIGAIALVVVAALYMVRVRDAGAKGLGLLRSQDAVGLVINPVTARTVPDPLGELPAAVEVAGYRIVAEATTNTVRHAGASRCDVTIDRDDEMLTIRIVDDGVGLPPDATPGVGLGSMRERASELGGTLTVGRASAGGTQVTATLPTASGRRDRPHTVMGSMTRERADV